SASVALMFIIGLSLLSPSVLLPSFLQSLQGYTPAQAGTLLAVRGLAAILAVMIAGWVIDRIDPRYLLASGVLAAAGSLVLLGGLSLDSPTGQVMFVGFMQGFGVPMILPPLSVVAYATLRLDQRAEGGVLLTLSRSIGSSIGISLAVAALARSTQVNQSYLVEHFTPYDYDRLQALGGAPGANAETAGLVAEVGRQAAAIAFSNTFHLIAVATLVALPFVWFMKVHRVRKLAPADLGELG
ncbi:MAG: MFS transporter, partial [Steroidobacteraceae bacterium]|nr:MFS transporter [Steroidobacteraceae bacterium]